MQGDGNLVLYQGGNALWYSGSAGQNCGANQCWAAFQGDGNFVVYNGTTAIWNSQTGGYPAAQLVLSNQLPYLKVVVDQSIIWASSGTFSAGSLLLSQGAYINLGASALIMQGDGNLVLYQAGSAIWNSGSAGQNCGANQCRAAFQGDGNFVVYNGSTAIWNSQTGGYPAAQLVLSSQDPFLKVVSNQTILWASSAYTTSVHVSNLTNPSMAPSFLAGDSYKYEVFGAPNQPVYQIQNNGTRNLFGYTDGNGYFVTSGVQQPAWCGHYTQVWFVGGSQASPSLDFTVSPAVLTQNLTHPNLTPNYAVGDTYQYTILGPPNQPVYALNNSSDNQYQGQTDANGRLVITMVGQVGWVGHYTQVWSVGNQTASPALTFVVGQLGSGTVTATNIGQTTDGHLEGVSSLSITNGVVNTYSATLLDYTASLYYDSNTVATLFDDRHQIGQAVAPVNISTAVNLNANATAWHDYDLQTDHYAIAYFFSGGYYQNPFYWGNSCYAETGGCSVYGGGVYAYWVTAAAIYMGSTLADQAYVPQDGSLPPFSLNAYDHFLAAAIPAYPSTAVFKTSVTEWIKAVGAAYFPIKLIYEAGNPNDTQDSGTSGTYPPIPLYLELIKGGDIYDLGKAERQRTFEIKNIYGHLWNMDFPLRIRERFTQMTTGGGASAPTPDGIWYNRLPEISPVDVEIQPNAQFTDHHRGTVFNILAQTNYVQYYYATDFTLPPSSMGLTTFFNVPGVSGAGMPLWIRDTSNKCSPSPDLPAEAISTSGQHVYINGDNGPGTGCRQ